MIQNSYDRGGGPGEWLLLIYQLPLQPAYLRVKIGRRLAKVGAVALRNGVYVLPESDAALEDFQWIVREIGEDGGEAGISSARFVGGMSDDDMRGRFRHARGADYLEIAEAARGVMDSLPSGGEEALQGARRELSRLQRRLEEVAKLDFFRASTGNDAETALMALRGRIDGERTMESRGAIDDRGQAERYRGRTWVTRQGIEVDRMASAWLIRRWIDPDARFKFVSAQGYRPAREELRFDMFEAEFTHEGDACTFEVLLRRLGPQDRALVAIGEMVHDVDLKDGKYGRPETQGLEALLAGIVAAHADDDARLARAAALLDDLYASLRNVGGGGR